MPLNHSRSGEYGNQMDQIERLEDGTPDERLARVEAKLDAALAILEELAPFARRAAVLMNNSRGFKIAELVARGRK